MILLVITILFFFICSNNFKSMNGKSYLSKILKKKRSWSELGTIRLINYRKITLMNDVIVFVRRILSKKRKKFLPDLTRVKRKENNNNKNVFEFWS